jgi:hypothetical protein
MLERRRARARARRLTKLPFRKAIRINDALERAFGVERVGNIFAAIRGQTKEMQKKTRL